MQQLTDHLLHRHDVTTERTVLVTLMLNPELFTDLDGMFPDEAFYSESVRKLHAAAAKVARREGCADFHLVAEQARQDGMKNAALELAGIVTDPNVVDTPTFCTAYFPSYARRLRKLYAEREKGRAALAYQGAVARGEDEQEARVMLDATLDALDALDPIEITTDDVVDMLGSAARTTTGYATIDQATGGLTKPGLNVIAARPSVGKSALARGIIRRLTARGTNVFWYSQDQSAAQVYELEIATLKRLNTRRVQQLTRAELVEAVTDVRVAWQDRVMLIDKPLTLPRLLSHARSSGAALIVIDYLQAIDTGLANESEYQSVTRTSKALKALALEMSVPVLALAQLNRQTARGGTPTLADLRASGQIEQDADQVWVLERDTTQGSVESQEALLHILKNKTGPTGSARLTWVGRYASYEDHVPASRYAGYVS